MVTQIPKWLNSQLSLAGAKRIEAAVIKAEQETSGEIVPLLVQSSTPRALVPVLSALLLMFLTFAVEYSLWGGAQARSWLGMFAMVGAAALGFLLGQLASVQRLLLPAFEQKACAQQRAMLEFYLAGLNKTEGGTGILLFVSLLEHQAVVLADQGIAQHCRPEIFQEVVNELIRGARSRDLAAGYEKAIDMCKTLLSPHFPRTHQDLNELKDYLHIKD